MSHGKQIATDLEVLLGFKEEFIVDNIPRDERMAIRWNCHIKQVYTLWNKLRFSELIDYGVTLRSGWLTEEGEKRLEKLLK